MLCDILNVVSPRCRLMKAFNRFSRTSLTFTILHTVSNILLQTLHYLQYQKCFENVYNLTAVKDFSAFLFSPAKKIISLHSLYFCLLIKSSYIPLLTLYVLYTGYCALIYVLSEHLTITLHLIY